MSGAGSAGRKAAAAGDRAGASTRGSTGGRAATAGRVDTSGQGRTGGPHRRAAIADIKRRYSERRCTDVHQLLSAMSNTTRFRILCALRECPFSVTELVEITDSNVSNVSQHLKMMWLAGYIERRREGKRVSYTLTNEQVRAAIELFESMYPPEAYTDDSLIE